MYFYLCVCVHMHTLPEGLWRPGEVSLDSLELELQVIGSCLVWVLGTEPRSSRRAVMLQPAVPTLTRSVGHSKEEETGLERC